MKSIKNYFRIKLLMASIIITAMFGLLITIHFAIESYSKLYGDTKQIFNALNLIYTQGTIDDAVIELTSRYIPHNRLAEHKAKGNLSALQEEGRTIASKLYALREQHLNRMDQLIHLSIYLLGPLAILILLLFIFANGYIKRLLTTTKNIIIHFNRHLFDSPTLEKPQQHTQMIPYQEMADMGNFIAYTIDTIHFIKEIQAIDISLSLETFIDNFGTIFCSDKYQHLLPCDRFSLALYSNSQDNSNSQDTLVAFHATVRGDRPVKLKQGFVQPINETSLKAMIDQRLSYRIINNLAEKTSETVQLLLQEGIRANLTIPIFIHQRIFGFIFFAHHQEGIYTDEMGSFALQVIKTIQDRVYYSYALQKSLSVFSGGIINIVEFKDDETADHTRRVSLYAELIAETLQEEGKITPQKVTEIRAYAPLHDVGKVGIPDAILFKPGKLTPEEWVIMKQHPLIGAKLLQKANKTLIDQIGFGLLYTAYNIVIDHHEWWDGSGYPNGKKGGEISIEGQIVAIADVFDALTTKRPYKEIIPIEQSLTMLQAEAGTHFNPALVDIFVSKYSRIVTIYQNNYALE